MTNITNTNIQFKVFLGKKDEKTLFAKSINTEWSDCSLVFQLDEIPPHLFDRLEEGFCYKMVAETRGRILEEDINDLTEEDLDVLRGDENYKKPCFFSERKGNLITFYLPKVVKVERIEQGFVSNEKPTDLYVQELGLQTVEEEYLTKKAKTI